MHMDDLRFEWDPAKDEANQKKHGVSFDEAKTAFSMTLRGLFLIRSTPKVRIGSYS